MYGWQRVVMWLESCFLSTDVAHAYWSRSAGTCYTCKIRPAVVRDPDRDEHWNVSVNETIYGQWHISANRNKVFRKYLIVSFPGSKARTQGTRLKFCPDIVIVISSLQAMQDAKGLGVVLPCRSGGHLGLRMTQIEPNTFQGSKMAEGSKDARWTRNDYVMAIVGV